MRLLGGGSRARRATTLLAFGLALPLLGGCGAISVIHDSMIGPISPAGRVERATRTLGASLEGRRVRVVDDRDDSEPRLRAFPRYPFRFVSRWDRVVAGARRGASRRCIVSYTREDLGNRVDPEVIAELEVGVTSNYEAVTRLGPPSLWLRRATGDVIVWEGELASNLVVRLGPGPATRFVPLPGLGNLKLDLGFGRGSVRRVVLLFASDGKLLAAVHEDGLDEEDADEAETPDGAPAPEVQQ